MRGNRTQVHLYLGAVARGALVTATLAGVTPVLAQTSHGSATWSLTPGSGDWNTATNWMPAAPPNGSGDTATFGASSTTNVSLSANTEVNGINFADAAGGNAYTITASPNTTLTISGVGVTNNSSTTQTLSTGASPTVPNQLSNQTFGTIEFRNTASADAAGPVAIVNSAGQANDMAVADTIFRDQSTAGGAAITNLGNAAGSIQGSIDYAQGGRTNFYDQSSAGSATIHNNVNYADAEGPATIFHDNSTAANATIYADGDPTIATSSGIVYFEDHSSAGAAKIFLTGNGGNDLFTGDGNSEGAADFLGNSTAGNAQFNVNGGVVAFDQQSTAGSSTVNMTFGEVGIMAQASGGTARFILGAQSALDVSLLYAASSPIDNLDPSSTSVGSLEGSGSVFLGHNGLAIGTNNLSTTFSGVISTQGGDGDGFAYSGDNSFALAKVGTGTLTLSGASTYTGPTLVNAGSLAVSGSLVSAVTVNSGGTLANSGQIGGLTVATGGALTSTGTPATIGVAGPASFASGSTVTLDIASSGASDLISINGVVSLGGATLAIDALPGSYTNQSYTLLSATGGYTGTFNFAGVTGGSLIGTPTLSYANGNVLLSFVAPVTPTHGSDIWKLAPVSGDWNTGANWVSGAVPNGSADTATFDQTSIANVSLSQNTEVSSITFNPGANANPYTITAAPGTTLTISGTGIVNNSGAAQTFVAAAAVTTSSAGGAIAFTNSANAGNANFVVNGAVGLQAGYLQFSEQSNAGTSTIHATSPGLSINDEVNFLDSASAGSAHIIIDGAPAGSFGSVVGFEGSSTAANATITVGGDGLNNINADENEGFVVFDQRATAGNASITGNGGRIQFFDAASAGNAIITANGGGIDFGDQADASHARIVLNGAAALDISDVGAATPDGSFAPGGIAVGSVEGSGFIRLGENTLTLGGTNLSTTFSGSITEGGREYDADFTCVAGTPGCFLPTTGNALVKTGTGTFTLSGASTYTGPTTVAQGTLAVTGSLVSAVTVNSGATITVSGTTGGLTLASGATAQGSGSGRMAVNGTVNTATGSTYAIGINAAGQSDQIAATGAATLAGGTVQVQVAPGTYKNGTEYTILSAAGGVTGTFSTLAGNFGSLLLRPSLVYTPDAVQLLLSRAILTGSTFNERAVAGALNAAPFTAPLLTALTTKGLPSNGQLDQASGEIHATMRSVLLDDGKLVREAVFDRLDTIASAPGMSSGISIWADVRGDRLTLDSDGNAARVHANGQATLVGADVGMGAWRFGAAYANSWGHAYVDDRASSARWNGDSVAVYGGGTLGPIALRAGGSYTWYRLTTDRNPILSPTLTERDSAHYDARLGQIFAEAAWKLVAGPLKGEVFGRWTGVRLSTDAFGEAGGADALTGAAHHNELGFALAGLRGSLPVGGRSSLALSAAWAHDIGRLTPSAKLAESSGSGFTVLGAPLARDAARVSATLATELGDRATLRVGYAGDIASGMTDHRANIGVGVSF